MKTPFYVIAASVPPGNRIVGFHGGGSDLLWDIPRFRHAGFDVAIPDSPEDGPDDSLELRWGNRKLLRLYQDGTLLFRGRADHDFLGWGVDPAKFAEFPKLNPVAVVEVHASFVHLYRRVLESLKKRATSVDFKLSLTDGTWDGKRLFLTQYFERGMVDWGAVTRYYLQEDPGEGVVTLSADEVLETPNRAAYKLLAHFCSWFDVPEGEIPFTVRGDDESEVDLDAIKAL